MPDPFALMRGLASQLEKGLDSLANRGVRSERLAQAAHKALSAQLMAKNVRIQLQNRVLEALNLPSRSDVLALAERLQAIEDRVIALSASLDRAGGERLPARGVLPLPAPPRTRRPPPQEAVPAPIERPVRRRRAKGPT